MDHLWIALNEALFLHGMRNYYPAFLYLIIFGNVI